MSRLLLERWFAAMDSDQPEAVLDMIEPDFAMSVVFSTQESAADFSGDRQALVDYLDQRLKNVRRHRLLSTSSSHGHELVLGEVLLEGEYEASFVAAARVSEAGLAHRLLIGRSPHTRFTDRQ